MEPPERVAMRSQPRAVVEDQSSLKLRSIALMSTLKRTRGFMLFFVF